MMKITIIAHDIRSAHNIGALLRTAEGLGIDKLYITGYSPYPISKDDQRLPHIASKVSDRISKTALGAESMIDWQYVEDPRIVITGLQKDGYTVLALEQTDSSIPLPDINKHLNLSPNSRVALLLGREVEGIDQRLIDLTDHCIEIPMFGQKESYNVVEAATMAMYQLRLSK